MRDKNSSSIKKTPFFYTVKTNPPLLPVYTKVQILSKTLLCR